MTHINIYTDSKFKNHKTGYGHPESPLRIKALIETVNQLKMDYPEKINIYSLDSNEAIEPEIVHTADYLNFLEKEIPKANHLLYLDEDTIASKESLEVALDGLRIMQQAIRNTVSNKCASFAMTRPPGHHALDNSSMGFCIFNNVAYAAKYAQKHLNINKILILDWDVHHFNGTEKIFYNDDSVMTISLHQYPHWPDGYGWVDKNGESKGKGFNLNYPLPIESGDNQIKEVFEEFIIPKIKDFQPELILVSSGFDAHNLERNSKLGVPSLLAFSDWSYAFMTQQLVNLAPSNKIMFLLEGGYYLPSLKSGVESVIKAIIEESNYLEPVTTKEEFDYGLWQEYKEAIRDNL